MKKLIAFILSFVLSSNLLYGICFANEIESESVFAECSFEGGNINTVGLAVSTEATVDTEGVLLDCREKIYENGMIDIVPAKGNIGVSVYSSVMRNIGKWSWINVTVEYLDEGSGWFFLRYTTPEGNKTSEYVNLTNTGKWCTYTFSVTGIPGGRGIMYGSINKGYDVEVCTTRCIWPENLDQSVRAWSTGLVTVKRITFAESEKNSNISADITTENVGNIFYGSDIPTFNVTFTNKVAEPIAFDATYKIYAYDKDMNKGEPISTRSASYNIGGSGVLTDTLNFDANKYGLYLLEAEFKSDNGYTDSKKTEFSKCTECNALNQTVGVAGHLMDRNRDQDYDAVLDLMKNAGLGIARDGMDWMQWLTDGDGDGTSDSEKSLSERHKNVLIGMRERNIEPLLLIFGNKSYAPEDKGFPGESRISEYNEFVRGVLSDETVKNTVDNLEIWNEPDLQNKISGEIITSNTPNRQRIQAQEYVRLLKNSYEIAKSIEGKDYTVGAFTVCMLSNEARDFMDYALSELSDYRSVTGNKPFDYLILHPYYSKDNDPEPGNKGTAIGWQPNTMGAKRYIIDYYKHLISGEPYYNSLDGSTETIVGSQSGKTFDFDYPDDKEIWLSETGISSAFDENSSMSLQGQYNQAKFIIRDVNQAKLNNFNNKIYIYDMVDDGVLETDEQSNFGLVRAVEANVPYAAKYSYLAVANYNRLTADTSSAEEVYNTDYDYVVKYSGDEGKNIYMMWTPKENGSEIEYELPVWEKVTYYDLLGNRLDESDVKNGDKYVLSQEPYYVMTEPDSEITDPRLPRKYSDENFEGYEGGMPVDFKEVYYGNYTQELVDAMTAETNNSSIALSMGGDSEKAIAYEFANSIYSGKFTVEFDVKANGGWSFGLMDESDLFDDTDYISLAGFNQETNNVSYAYWDKEYKAGNITEDWATWSKNKTTYFNSWINEKFASEGTENPDNEWLYKRIGDMNKRRRNNTLIGNMNDAKSEDFSKLYTAKGKAEFGDTELSGVTVNEWTHIKAVVDLDAGKYSFYLNDSNTPIVVDYNQATDGNYENGRFSRIYLRDTAGNYKVLGGIAGIRLQKYGEAAVSFDNIKVYTDKSYNDYLDFNTSETAKTQPGWYSNKAQTWQTLEYFGHNGENQRVAVEGASGNTEDKAVKFSQGWQFYTHPFAVPVKAGNPFSVEFDLKADDTSRWVLNLLDESNMVRNASNSPATATIFNGEKGTNSRGKEDPLQITVNGVLSNSFNSGVGFGVGTTGENAGDFTSTGIEYKTNEWQHIKLDITPVSTNNTTLKLTVTYADKTSKSYTQNISYSWYTSGQDRFLKYDTCGMMFSIPGGVGAGIAIDNFKVSETEAVPAAAVSIKSVGTDGNAADINGNVAMPIMGLRAEFTAAMENADGIELYYTGESKKSEAYAPTYTKTLSADGKSVDITLLDFEINKSMTLAVSNKTKFTSSGLAQIPTTYATFMLTGNPEGNYDNVEVTEFRMYEFIPSKVYEKWSYEVPAVWIPIMSGSNASGKKLKLVAKGINYGESIDVMLAGCEYVNDNGVNRFSNITMDSKTPLPSGTFERELEVEDGTEEFDTLKGIFWQLPDMRPFAKSVSISGK